MTPTKRSPEVHGSGAGCFRRDTAHDDDETPRNLKQLLERMTSAGTPETICVEDILNAVGARAFGACLLVPSLILVSPVSGIPGAPTVGAIIIALIAGQMLFGRRTVWLPQYLMRRCLQRGQVEKSVAFLGPGARLVDKAINPRLDVLTRGIFRRLIAAACVLLALCMPLLEPLPFLNSLTAASVAAFALSLVAHDGLLAIAALGLMALGLGLAITGFL
ncbi:MAG: exopolysaccharide biosynthesis protein [Rhodospirillales bacterium]